MKYARMIYARLPFNKQIDKLYYMLPDGVKYGSLYEKKMKLLEDSQWWDRERLLEYQLAELKRLMIHAYEHTKYYHRIFLESGFNPYSFKADEIRNLPLLDKETLQKNYEDLIADNIPERMRTHNSTGGTTGNQLHFMGQKNTDRIELPYVVSIWKRAGYAYGKDLLAVLRNEAFDKGELFRMDYKHNRLIFNNFHLNDHNIEMVLTKLCEEKVQFLHTYPSAALTLAEYITRKNKKYPLKLKAILVTSENLYPGQKELMEETLGGRVFTFYGHSERACIAGWCEYTDKYHLNSEYGYTELIDDNGEVITKPGINGEIVATGFSNYVMPFIRYRTGDYSSYSVNQQCICGRHYILLDDIDGRWMQEMIIRKDGSKLSITALNMHSQIFANIRNYQMVQEIPGELIINIVKGENYCEKDEDEILREFGRRLGFDFVIHLNYQTAIEKTVAGKHRYLIQKLLK